MRDIVGIFSFNIFVGIAVATIFGSGFFFDLFWPQRAETSAVKKAWKICSVLMCIFTLADAIALTVSLQPSSTISTSVTNYFGVGHCSYTTGNHRWTVELRSTRIL